MSPKDSAWETVHTVDDWYDGPRAGVADFEGRPHPYRSTYVDTEGWSPDEDRFELTPISSAALSAAVELDAIWQRWRAADPQPPDTEDMALPEDRARRAQLQTAWDAEYAHRADERLLVHGEFELGCARVRWWRPS